MALEPPDIVDPGVLVGTGVGADAEEMLAADHVRRLVLTLSRLGARRSSTATPRLRGTGEGSEGAELAGRGRLPHPGDELRHRHHVDVRFTLQLPQEHLQGWKTSPFHSTGCTKSPVQIIGFLDGLAGSLQGG